ncbi:unnamed protein product [Symbiodinium natans]|uniref:Uncharacterized protein n=1 Tax=Symbiodinium natans TaxID=878477 RepID=A0A812S839_9DINO|nr:unnamed protein product [Symbiodinium natans]
MSHRPCENGDQCRAWLRLKSYEVSQADIDHVSCWAHPHPPCRYGDQCRAWLRLQEGGYRLDDQAHVAVYDHGGRARGDRAIFEGMAKFATMEFTDAFKMSERLREAASVAATRSLWEEVKVNGYARVLEVSGHPSAKTLDDIVALKLSSERHKELGEPLNHEEMLSILLYTGCDCYGDLRRAERDRDFKKWARFACVLDLAIYNLAMAAAAKGVGLTPKVYHGLGNVALMHLPIDKVEYGDLGSIWAVQFTTPTFMSTSWNRSVAEGFIDMNSSEGSGLRGLLIEMEGEEASLVGADVSWISKFPHECEVLLGRFTTFTSQTVETAEGDQSMKTVRDLVRDLKIVVEAGRLQHASFTLQAGTVWGDEFGSGGSVYLLSLPLVPSVAQCDHPKWHRSLSRWPDVAAGRRPPTSFEELMEYMGSRECYEQCHRGFPTGYPLSFILFPLDWSACRDMGRAFPLLHLQAISSARVAAGMISL